MPYKAYTKTITTDNGTERVRSQDIHIKEKATNHALN